MLKLKIILGSTRPTRFSEKIAPWITDLAKKHGDFEVEVLDLRDYHLPLYDQPVTPSQIKDGAYANDIARAWAKKIGEAEAYIMITAEYDRAAPAVLINAIQWIYYEWNKKPLGVVSYGTVGGTRAAEQLRTMSIELQMAPVRTAVQVPVPWTLLDKGGALPPGALDVHLQSAGNMLEQLSWWGSTLKSARG